MQKITLTEETFLGVIQMLSELAANYAVTATLFHTARENNFLELFEKNDKSVYKANQELETLRDPHFKEEFKFKFVEGTLDLQFERNDGKNSVKFFGKQFPKNRQFLPFGTDLFISDDRKYAVAIYTRKDAILTDVIVFSTETISDYLSSIVYRAKHKELS